MSLRLMQKAGKTKSGGGVWCAGQRAHTSAKGTPTYMQAKSGSVPTLRPIIGAYLSTRWPAIEHNVP